MTDRGNVILQVENVKKYFYGSRKGLFSRERACVKAVDGVSFSVRKGETFGIVGESGCGKSTLCKTLLHLIEPTSGEIFLEGTNLSELSKEEIRLLRNKMQIIFQDPYASLNPRMTVRELIKAPLDIFSTDKEEEKMKTVVQIMHLVGLNEEFINKYPHEFSGGQRQRIMIARALILNPDVVFCDEPVSALDVSVRAQVLNLMKTLQKKLDLTYIFISHDLSVVRYLCDRVAVMYLGRIVEVACKDDLYENPLHPYTKCLLSSIPVPDPESKTERIVLEGDVPSAYDPPSGCHFHTRCMFATEKCSKDYPGLIEVEKDHLVACHLCPEGGLHAE
ncbi:dipeptide ABC transporter ATP-binding protein [uncultured Sphaerochaeta sp.]|uniref:ABC transporter ATP-binding protein n=1 Tax=uncultured Sphaerochaeta sp. TaxID=886478 RepID=UPI002A0A756D|nr:dipeptide ABC transporter ATP-binding protein [uncultured Sphaerochaeta sp.]